MSPGKATGAAAAPVPELHCGTGDFLFCGLPFRAGARRVFPGVAAIPLRLDAVDQLVFLLILPDGTRDRQ